MLLKKKKGMKTLQNYEDLLDEIKECFKSVAEIVEMQLKGYAQ